MATDDKSIAHKEFILINALMCMKADMQKQLQMKIHENVPNTSGLATPITFCAEESCP